LFPGRTKVWNSLICWVFFLHHFHPLSLWNSWCTCCLCFRSFIHTKYWLFLKVETCNLVSEKHCVLNSHCFICYIFTWCRHLIIACPTLFWFLTWYLVFFCHMLFACPMFVLLFGLSVALCVW
jgi:hypothetical protein